MSLVVEARSLTHQRGVKVAHPITITRQHFDGPISRNPYVSDPPSLEALVDLVCARTEFPYISRKDLFYVRFKGFTRSLKYLVCYPNRLYVLQPLSI
jgi:hypothetical protein